MRLLTLNIWNYTRPWKERRSLISELILHADPDVVCLQETRHDFRYYRGRGQGEQIADEIGMHVVSKVAQVYWPFPRVDEGLAILTRTPPERVMVRELTQLGGEREDENRRVCVGVALPSDGVNVSVFNTHFSLSARARLSNAREVARFVADCGDEPAFLFGDLNCEPDADPIQFLVGALDIDGERGDFTDCWRALHPDDPGLTYGSFDPVRRIDYALGRNIEGTLRDAQIVGTDGVNGVYPSDHMGILLDVELGGSA